MALPIGTVSLLFTDIEGSTALLRAHPHAYPGALVRHHALLQEAVEANRGQVVQTEGDAVFAAFARSTDAIAAALWGQLALQAEPWGDAGPIKVRMGVHTGEVELYGAQYVGLAIHRAARLASTAHGGQVVLSEATAVHLRDAFPHEVHLIDLGEHRLKDLTHPERIWQLGHADLPAAFPPLRSLDTLPNNLPRQSTPFLGRERELDAVKALLRQDDVRLLTLLGPGGTGKTRLALQVAADLLDEFRHGVFFVPLASVSDATLLPSAIAQALEVREETGTALEDTLQRHLREKQLLLVLDNFEQLSGAESWMAQLLRGAPGLRLLVTSRAALRVYGEREFPVPTLTLPDLRRLPPIAGLSQYESVRLFIDRARAILPDFAITNENAPAVAELCHRLDGLPLAIELVAARVRLLAPEQILERLAARGLGLRTGGARDLPGRQQTLRGTIAWSYDLLTSEEQTLFRRLSVFTDGCTLDAAEAVCDADGVLGCFDVMESLVSKSLLKQEDRDGEPRFLMLETIHEFAGGLLVQQGEVEDAQRCHARYFAALAAAADAEVPVGPARLKWDAQLEAEHQNLCAAQQWLLDQGEHGATDQALGLGATLWFFRSLSGFRREAADQVTGLLAHGRRGDGPSSVGLMRVLEVAGWMAARLGDYAAGEALLEEALVRARASDDARCAARILNTLGVQHRQRGDGDRAVATFEEAIALGRQVRDRFTLGNACVNLAWLICTRGDYPRAASFVQEQVRWARESGELWLAVPWLILLGDLGRGQGDLAADRARYEAALTMARTANDPGSVAQALVKLAQVATQQNDFPTATATFEECLAIGRGTHDKSLIWQTLGGLGQMAERQGDFVAARGWLEEGLAMHRLSGRDHVTGVSELTVLANLSRLEGDLTAAQSRYAEALAVARELGNKNSLLDARRQYGWFCLRAGRAASARTEFDAALSLAREIGNKQFFANVCHGLGVLARSEGDYATARQFIAEARQSWRDYGDRSYDAYALSEEAEIAREEGDFAASRLLHEQSIALQREAGNRHAVPAMLNAAGYVARESGDDAASRALHSESLELASALGDRIATAEACSGLALLALAQGQYATARIRMEEGLTVRREVNDQIGMPLSLEGFASLAAATAQPDCALRLAGAAAAHRARHGNVLWLADQRKLDARLAPARAALSEEAQALAWSEGEAMTLEQAIADALALPASDPA